jgi:pantothenate kinase
MALTGCEDFGDLCRLAAEGDRGRVDLLVSDLYTSGEIPLPGEVTAASFGHLARWLSGGRTTNDAPRAEDLAHALMGLVGENVALLCAAAARTADVAQVRFGGATLRDNPSLVGILMDITGMLGIDAQVLPDGGHAGAVGALGMAMDLLAVEG